MVRDPELDTGGWWFWVVSDKRCRYGPFATEEDARLGRERLFGRWNRAARRHGGWAWKMTHTQWHVTLPATLATALPPMRNRPCTVHAS